MDKKVIIFKEQIPKKHSVCFKTSDKEAAVTSIYVMRASMGKPIPKAIKVTIEEAE